MNILSIDIGGTSTKMALLDDKGNFLKRYEPIKTTKGHSLKWLFDYIKILDIKYDVIGIDVPGFYNSSKQMIELSGNLNYKNFNLIKEAKKYTNKKVYCLNDANAAALGEYWKIFSKESNVKNVLFYIIGTGIGGGLIIDGKLYEGSNGYAGEFGHGCFADNNKCSCGQKGCIEPKCSAVGITKLINEEAKNKSNHELYKLKQEVGKIEIYHLKKLIKEDKRTIDVFKKCLEPLINHMCIMSYAIDPNAIIIGGGPSKLGSPLIKIVSDIYKEKSAQFISKNIKIKKAICENDAALYGNVFYILSNM